MGGCFSKPKPGISSLFASLLPPFSAPSLLSPPSSLLLPPSSSPSPTASEVGQAGWQPLLLLLLLRMLMCCGQEGVGGLAPLQ